MRRATFLGLSPEIVKAIRLGARRGADYLSTAMASLLTFVIPWISCAVPLLRSDPGADGPNEPLPGVDVPTAGRTVPSLTPSRRRTAELLNHRTPYAPDGMLRILIALIKGGPGFPVDAEAVQAAAGCHGRM